MPTIFDYEELSLDGINVDSVSRTFSILEAKYGDGYSDAVRVGSAAGTHTFELSTGVWPDDENVAAIGSQSWFDYYYQFYADRVSNGNEPFVLEWRGRKWHVSFVDPTMSFEAFTADLFAGGLQVRQRRVRGVIYDPDGPFPPADPDPYPPTLTGPLTISGDSSTEMLVSWPMASDEEEYGAESDDDYLGV